MILKLIKLTNHPQSSPTSTSAAACQAARAPPRRVGVQPQAAVGANARALAALRPLPLRLQNTRCSTSRHLPGARSSS